MSTQAALFDAKQGDRLKRQGMERAQSARLEVVLAAQRVAVVLAIGNREVTADDVWRYMHERGMQPELLGNAAGSLFPRINFEWTGRWVKSKRASNHGRMIRVWRLR